MVGFDTDQAGLFHPLQIRENEKEKETLPW